MNSCGEVRGSLGVYVVGAIDPAERTVVDHHLSDCQRCRDELASLAGLPALLGRVTEEQIEQIASPPAELLDGLLAAAASKRGRTHRWRRGQAFGRTRPARWRAMAAVAASIIVLVAGVLGGVRLIGGDEPAREKAWSAAVVDPVTRVHADVAASPKPGGRGTALKIAAGGIPRGTWCDIWAVGRDGTRDLAGGWKVYAKYGRYATSTSIKPSDLAALEISTGQGKKLVTLTQP